MGTKINYEKYGISKERYEELRAFCLQYKEYKTRLRKLKSGVMSCASVDEIKNVEEKIKLIEKCVKEVCASVPGVNYALLRNVTEHKCGYEMIMPPMSKNSFYKLRKDFFVLLNETKK